MHFKNIINNTDILLCHLLTIYNKITNLFKNVMFIKNIVCTFLDTLSNYYLSRI